ncbi:MAG: hypothetical protein N2508_07740 [Anaerolineae bacterium]|nr:hypothetical protein [Anaerolineae bacterium]
MPETGIDHHGCTPRTLPADVVRTLDEISRQLSQIADTYRDIPEAEALKASQEKLETISRELGNPRGEEKSEAQTRPPERLRREILGALQRGGPAFFPELAAVTLSLPDEIRPVLREMEREGLVEIKTLRGWQQVSLTARGRQEAKRL